MNGWCDLCLKSMSTSRNHEAKEFVGVSIPGAVCAMKVSLLSAHIWILRRLPLALQRSGHTDLLHYLLQGEGRGAAVT